MCRRLRESFLETLAVVRGESLLRQSHWLHPLERRSPGTSRIPQFNETHGCNVRFRCLLLTYAPPPRKNPQVSFAQSLLADLALSDYNLQDALVGADSLEVSERDVDNQTFVDFDLFGYFGAIFACVTVYGGRVYAVFSFVPER